MNDLLCAARPPERSRTAGTYTYTRPQAQASLHAPREKRSVSEDARTPRLRHLQLRRSRGIAGPAFRFPLMAPMRRHYGSWQRVVQKKSTIKWIPFEEHATGCTETLPCKVDCCAPLYCSHNL